MSSKQEPPITPDCIISAIQDGRLSVDNISFQKIRKLCVRVISQLSEEEDARLKRSLGRGKNILQTASQLDKYSYTHGLMIESQWSYMFNMLKLEPRSAHVIDYGCGQGLSTSLFLDNYRKEHFSFIEKITLIEPSHVALERAEAIVKCYMGRVEVKTMNMDFDEFNRVNAEGNTGGLTYHLFSNVLDINGYDHLKLLSNAISTTGENIILGVSHDRNGSLNIRACKKQIDSLKDDKKYAVKDNFIETFKCNNDKNDAIALCAHVEVHDGSV